MSDWQPIETAPKNGTLIDLWVVPRNGAAAGRVTDAGWRAGAFRFLGFNSDPAHPGPEVVADITHWMPLPPAPVG